jgi:anti-sigma factor (TIGR02949 family)
MIRADETMSCDEARELLEPWLDGDLPAGEAARVRAHLDHCAECTTELDLAALIQRELRSLPQHDCPPEVLQRVLDTGRGEVVPFEAPRRAHTGAAKGFRIAVAAALLAAIVGGLSFLIPERSPANPSPAEVAQATREARLALAYVGQVTRRAGLGLRDDVLRHRLIDPTTRSVRGLGAFPTEQ